MSYIYEPILKENITGDSEDRTRDNFLFLPTLHKQTRTLLAGLKNFQLNFIQFFPQHKSYKDFIINYMVL